MDRNKIVKFGAIVMILSLLVTIFVGAMSIQPVKAATPAATTEPIIAPKPGSNPATSPTGAPNPNTPANVFDQSQVGPNGDVDGDGVKNNEDPDINGNGLPNGTDPDIDGDGIPNNDDGNPTSTNLVDSSTPGQFASESAWQWVGGALVLAVFGWLVALPYLRKRKGTSSKSVGSRTSATAKPDEE